MTDPDDLLQRRLRALDDEDLVMREWDMTFAQDVCRRRPADLTQRQREMVALLCWRYRAQLAPDVVPTAEPRLSPSQRRRSFGPPATQGLPT